MSVLTEQFIKALKPGGKVAELGAGDGQRSALLAERGFEVTAIDTKKPKKVPKGVEWLNEDIRSWAEGPTGADYDGFLLERSLGPLSKREALTDLFPHLKARTAIRGVIAIETLSRPPEPDFEKNARDYYTLHELQNIFPSWDMVLTEETTEEEKDMDGAARTFHVTRLIVKKPEGSTPGLDELASPSPASDA